MTLQWGTLSQRATWRPTWQLGPVPLLRTWLLALGGAPDLELLCPSLAAADGLLQAPADVAAEAAAVSELLPMPAVAAGNGGPLQRPAGAIAEAAAALQQPAVPVTAAAGSPLWSSVEMMAMAMQGQLANAAPDVDLRRSGGDLRLAALDEAEAAAAAESASFSVACGNPAGASESGRTAISATVRPSRLEPRSAAGAATRPCAAANGRSGLFSSERGTSSGRPVSSPVAVAPRT
jgi:hypothetical protein